jgi:hypothetical protein
MTMLPVQKIGLSLLAACGIFQTGMGFYFLRLRPTLLPEDERFIGLSLDALARVAPGLPVWLDRVFVVLGGHAMATGLLTLVAAIVLWGSQRIPRTALALLLAAGLASVVLMSAVNFAIHSEFRWLLLAPALAWTIAVVLLGMDSSRRGKEDLFNRRKLLSQTEYHDT